MGLEDRDVAEHTLREQLPQRDEVSHIAAVLEGRQYTPLRLAEPDQLRGLRHGRGERLIDDDVAPGQEALLREGVMGGIGCGDHDQVHRPGEQVVDTPDKFDIGIARIG